MSDKFERIQRFDIPLSIMGENSIVHETVREETTLTEQKPGHALLYVRDQLVDHLSLKIEKPKAGLIYWNLMEIESMVKPWRELLQLPEGYSIIGVYFEVSSHCWLLLIESTRLRSDKEGARLPRLKPNYTRGEDGMIRMVSMELERP